MGRVKMLLRKVKMVLGNLEKGKARKQQTEKGQAEVGFVLRVALGFIVLVSVTYMTYLYLENAEKTKMNQFLEGLADYVSIQIAQTIYETGENQTIYKTFYLPSSGDPLAGKYYVAAIEKDGQAYLELKPFKWQNYGVLRPLYLNTTRFHVDGVSSPTIMCINVTRVNNQYSIALRC